MPTSTLKSSLLPSRRERRGALLVVLIVTLPVFLIMAVFAINVAYMELTRTELRAATDFTARAGARRLSMTGSQSLALTEAQNSASRQLVNGQALNLDPEDVVFGVAAQATPSAPYVFTPGGPFPNAAQVTGNRVGAGEQVPLLFGSFLATGVFEPSMQSVATQTDRDIAIVLDRSGSMARLTEDGQNTGWLDGDPAPNDSRWEMALQATSAFLAALDSTPMSEKVSLVTYADTATSESQLTFDSIPFAGLLDVYTQAYPDGWTNIADGIEVATQTLVGNINHRGSAQMTIVVLTDGIHNAGSITPQEAATTAASQGVTVHTITFGNDANQTDMADVAAIGNGQHWHAPDQVQLIQAFNEIANSTPTMLVE